MERQRLVVNAMIDFARRSDPEARQKLLAELNGDFLDISKEYDDAIGKLDHLQRQETDTLTQEARAAEA